MQGCDRELSPVLYVKPNYKKRNFKDFPGLSDYQYFFVYILETMLPLINKLEGFSERLSIILDLDEKEFPIDLLELIQILFTKHYPQRLGKIFIVKIDLNKIN